MIFNVSKSYEDMLNKIAIFTWGFLIAGWYCILLSFPEFTININNFINNFFELKDPITIFGFKLPITFLIPTAIALIFRIVKLHDKISDIFKIRFNYDLENIILPLAEGSEASINSISKIKKERLKLMYDIFYKYAGYTEPKIDSHLINMALDSLCWYWIVIEGLTVTCITFFICIFSSKLGIIRFLFLIIVVLMASYLGLKKTCVKKTNSEVKAILSKEERKCEIRKVFYALQNKE